MKALVSSILAALLLAVSGVSMADPTLDLGGPAYDDWSSMKH